MEYTIIGICFLALLTVILLYTRVKSRKSVESSSSYESTATDFPDSALFAGKKAQELAIQIGILSAEVVPDESRLVEISDAEVLAYVNNMISELGQTGNAINNAVRAARDSGDALYVVIMPPGRELVKSKAMEGAFLAQFTDPNGRIAGHAKLLPADMTDKTVVAANAAAATMRIASMVVGQYYMAQINNRLDSIHSEVARVANFQDDEYKGKVFALFDGVKKIANYRAEILRNDELRQEEKSHLNEYEDRCNELLGQANSALERSTKKTGLNYDDYEKEVVRAQKWIIYQEVLTEILSRISELKYALKFGGVSREFCTESLHINLEKQRRTQADLIQWHKEAIKRHNIDVVKTRRKRGGVIGRVYAWLGWSHKDSNYIEIKKETGKLISSQLSGRDESSRQDTTDLYAADVQLIAKDGRIFYLPEGESV